MPTYNFGTTKVEKNAALWKDMEIFNAKKPGKPRCGLPGHTFQ